MRAFLDNDDIVSYIIPAPVIVFVLVLVDYLDVVIGGITYRISDIGRTPSVVPLVVIVTICVVVIFTLPISVLRPPI